MYKKEEHMLYIHVFFYLVAPKIYTKQVSDLDHKEYGHTLQFSSWVCKIYYDTEFDFWPVIILSLQTAQLLQ